MNSIKTFFTDLFYQPKHLFFRKYFGRLFALFFIYLSLELFSTVYTSYYNDFKIYKGNIEYFTFEERLNKKEKKYNSVIIKLENNNIIFKTHSLIIDKSILESRFLKKPVIYIHCPSISLKFDSKKTIHQLEDSEGIIYKHNIDYKSNFQSAIISLVFAIWLLWISRKR